ncbi:translation elongation factor Ts [Aminomonas paucivorans]|uniref:Elongation factor Ts n=1 Tax=Aminomonas paucivorans DSM 12260 TaxID=584708 RepID=E3CXX8_9BACT|nr:translation elongation factor Ts [Aminomonas paucivorans]EFQ23588.1 translation elongation factor Ts (EF-Ts) [Aminomonas paucivorans DSM 12260]
MALDMESVKELRARTGAGVLDCKKALAECGDDVEKAVDYLREKGLAKAAKKVGRTAAQGLVFSYIHTNGKIGVLVELNCETDFVARTDEFQQLGHEIAMQIAAANPQYVSPEEVPSDDLEREKEIYRNQALEEGKPAHIVDKIAEGRVNKFYEETCLLEQNYIRDPDRKIKDMVIDNIAKMGENIVVRRFARYSIGE